MNRFQPVGFTLAVIAIDDVESRSPKDFSAQVAKIINFEGVEDHQEILAHESRL